MTELGGLDVLVNNVGIEVTQLLVDTEPDQIRSMLDVNVLGTMLGLKHGLRAMRRGCAAGNGGTVINIASVAATIAFPGIAGYSATKDAQTQRVYESAIGLTDTLVPLVRVQHLDIARGPLDKLFGTATLAIHTAGTHNSIVSLPGLSPARAAELAAAIRTHIKADLD